MYLQSDTLPTAQCGLVFNIMVMILAPFSAKCLTGMATLLATLSVNMNIMVMLSVMLSKIMLIIKAMLIVTTIMGFCNCSMFCCALLYAHSSFAIILMGKRELVVLLSLTSWCLVIVGWLFLAMQWVCLQFMVFPVHTYLLFMLRVPFNVHIILIAMVAL